MFSNKVICAEYSLEVSLVKYGLVDMMKLQYNVLYLCKHYTHGVVL